MPKIQGSYSYDILAEMLKDYPRDCNIQNKVVLSNVNNSLNFIKAFSVLAALEDVTENKTENKDKVLFTNIISILNETEHEEYYHLPDPNHHTYHTFHLVQPLMLQ